MSKRLLAVTSRTLVAADTSSAESTLWECVSTSGFSHFKCCENLVGMSLVF